MFILKEESKNKIFSLYIFFIQEAIHILATMTHVAKIVEIDGSSDKGWEDAVQVAADEDKKNHTWNQRNRIIDMTAKVDPSNGMITQYRACIKLSFGIEHQIQKFTEG